jgi:hypothetical protein
VDDFNRFHWLQYVSRNFWAAKIDPRRLRHHKHVLLAIAAIVLQLSGIILFFGADDTKTVKHSELVSFYQANTIKYPSTALLLALLHRL